MRKWVDAEDGARATVTKGVVYVTLGHKRMALGRLTGMSVEIEEEEYTYLGKILLHNTGCAKVVLHVDTLRFRKEKADYLEKLVDRLQRAQRLAMRRGTSTSSMRTRSGSRGLRGKTYVLCG